MCGRHRPLEPSAWVGGRVSRCLRRSGNEWCRGEVRKHRKAEAHLKGFSDNEAVEPLGGVGCAWRGGRLTGATLGAWRTVHRLNGTGVSGSVWGGAPVWSLEPASHTSTWALTHPGCFWPVTEADWALCRSMTGCLWEPGGLSRIGYQLRGVAR